jgi:sigma-E factor negative regulatory protein RseC
MLSENGVVVAVEKDQVWVETIRSSACETCRAKSVCGQKVMTDFQSERKQKESSQAQKSHVPVRTNLIMQIGDQVEIGIPEAAFIKGALLLYFLPILSLVLTAILISSLGLSEWLVAAVSIFSFVVSLGWVKYKSNQWQDHEDFRPVLLRKLAA